MSEKEPLTLYRILCRIVPQLGAVRTPTTEAVAEVAALLLLILLASLLTKYGEGIAQFAGFGVGILAFLLAFFRLQLLALKMFDREMKDHDDSHGPKKEPPDSEERLYDDRTR